MINQEDTGVFQESNPLEQALGDVEQSLADLHDIFVHLDSWVDRENAAKAAALAEYENMKKLAAYKIGDAYEVRAEEMKQAKEYESCEYCGMNHRNCPL